MLMWASKICTSMGLWLSWWGKDSSLTRPRYEVQFVVVTCDIWDGQLTLNWGALLMGILRHTCTLDRAHMGRLFLALHIDHGLRCSWCLKGQKLSKKCSALRGDCIDFSIAYRRPRMTHKPFPLCMSFYVYQNLSLPLCVKVSSSLSCLVCWGSLRSLRSQGSGTLILSPPLPMIMPQSHQAGLKSPTHFMGETNPSKKG